jgi:Domain of unknown function (DUF4372)
MAGEFFTSCQYCPTDLRVIGLKSSAVKDFLSIQGVNDLNSKCVICQSAGIFTGGTDARWQTCVRSSYGVRAWHTFRRLIVKDRGDFNIRTSSCLDQFLCMAFAQSTVDLPGESTRTADQALSPGCAWHGQSQRAGRCQRVADWRIHVEFAQARIRMPARCMPRSRSVWSSTKQSTRWMPPPSTCAWHCFRGRRFVPPKPPSNCTSCSICAARFPRLSISATAHCTTATC